MVGSVAESKYRRKNARPDKLSVYNHAPLGVMVA